MWHKDFFKMGPVAGPEPTRVSQFQKCLGPRRHSPFWGRFRRRAINPNPPKRVKAWGGGPLRPEVLYPVVEHTRKNHAARNHGWSGAPHHWTQSSARKKARHVLYYIRDWMTESKLYLLSKLMCFKPLLRNIHWNLRGFFFVCFS